MSSRFIARPEHDPKHDQWWLVAACFGTREEVERYRKPSGRDVRCAKCAAGMIPCPIGACDGHWPTNDGPCDSPRHGAAEEALG